MDMLSNTIIKKELSHWNNLMSDQLGSMHLHIGDNSTLNYLNQSSVLALGQFRKNALFSITY